MQRANYNIKPSYQNFSIETDSKLNLNYTMSVDNISKG